VNPEILTEDVSADGLTLRLTGVTTAGDLLTHEVTWGSPARLAANRGVTRVQFVDRLSENLGPVGTETRTSRVNGWHVTVSTTVMRRWLPRVRVHRSTRAGWVVVAAWWFRSVGIARSPQSHV
jgi:hypothetical protein